MDFKNIMRLIALSAVWGSSFIFMRVIAPVLGPILTASMRTLLAGIFLLIIFQVTRFKINWKKDWKVFFVLGIVNSSIPFFMFAFAALYIPASLSAIINSMTPMFGALFASVFMIEKMTKRKFSGLILGSIGVSVISSVSMVDGSQEVMLAILACLTATICYGISSVYIKLKASGIDSKAITAGSQLFAGLVLLPFGLGSPIKGVIDLKMIGLVIAFALICNALAYLLFYKLIAEVGPTKSLTVTFVIPIFGILWGYMLLGESISSSTIYGGVIILLGTYLVTSSKVKHTEEVGEVV